MLRARALPNQNVKNNVALVGCLAIVAVLGVVIVLYVRSCGSELAEIALDETPREARFELQKPARIGFATSYELKDSRFAYREDLPHALDYEIEILRGEQRVASLVCNPFAMFVRRTGKSGQTLTALSGKLDGCSANLSTPGQYVIRARRAWRSTTRPLTLAENTLSVEVEG